MKVLLIANAASGKASTHARDEILRALRRLGSVEVLEPSSREAFAPEARQAGEEAELVISAGGDGTLNCTIDALRDRLEDLTFAVIPMGTGNDLARTLGIADLEPVEVARWIPDAPVNPLDVGIAAGASTERLFVNACMGGFPVQVNEALSGADKERLGPAAFIWGGAKALADLERSTVELQRTSVPHCVAAGVGNGRSCGGGIQVWPDADPSDGLLDACALPAEGVAGLVKLGAALKLGRHPVLDGVITTRSSSISIDADPPIEINVDGELIGLRTPATFEIFAKTRMIVPTPGLSPAAARRSARSPSA